VGPRDLFFAAEKLRAPWRVLAFLLLTTAAYGALQVLLASTLTVSTEHIAGLALYSALLSVALLVASYTMMRWVERRPLAALGLPLGTATLTGLMRGAAVGAGLIGALAIVQAAAGWLQGAPAGGTAAGWLKEVGALALLFAVAAAAEELLFRGYAFRVLVEALGPVLAVTISSALFGLIHVANPGADPLALVNIGLAGVLMAIAYLRSGSLWVAIGLHWAWNWVMAAVLDLPVSGLDFDVPLYDTRVVGPDVATGGGFGPEAGLLMTACASVAIVWAARARLLEDGSTAGGRPWEVGGSGELGRDNDR